MPRLGRSRPFKPLVRKVTILSAPGTFYTLTAPTPAQGDLTVASGNFTVSVTGTLASPVHVTPAVSGITGTFGGLTSGHVTLAAGTNPSATFTFTPSKWGVGTISTTNDGGLTNPLPVSYLGMVQLGISGTASTSGGAAAGNIAPAFGGFDLLGVGPYFAELKRDISGDSLDPNSSAIMGLFSGSPNIHIDFSATASGTTQAGVYGIPFNVVAGTQSTQAITYSLANDAGTPVPIPFPASFEGTIPSDDPPTDVPTGDRHLLVCVRNETTGGIDHTLEFYQIYWNGSAWVAEDGCYFNNATGVPRADDTTSQSGPDAAALPMTPLLLKYEEVASGDVGHTLRATFPEGMIGSWAVYPARSQVNDVQSRARLQWGARIRLNDTWYQANKGTYSGQARTILDGMHKYGVINADITGVGLGSGFYLGGVTDDRWDPDDTTHGIFALQNVPMSAFEVPLMQPRWTVTGPSSGPVGTPQTFTITYEPSTDLNFAGEVYILVDGTTDGLSTSGVPLTPSTLTGTFTYTPSLVGAHTINTHHGDQVWYPALDFTFTAGQALAATTTGGTLSTATPASGTPFTLTAQGSGSGSDIVTVTGPGGSSASARVIYPVGSSDASIILLVMGEWEASQ